MTILTLQDLTHTETLDRKALAAVQGGKMSGAAAPFWLGDYDGSTHDSSLKADQFIGQNQQVTNLNGNNVALVCGIESTVKPRQEASNSITRL